MTDQPADLTFSSGNYQLAPWLFPGVKAPGGKRLPDKHVIEKSEWNASAT